MRSCHTLTNESSHKAIPVLIGDLLEGPGGVPDGGGAALVNLHEVESVLDHVGDGLGIRSGAGAAAEDVVGDRGELVRHSVSDPGAHAGAAVGAYHHAAIELHSAEGGASGHLHNDYVEYEQTGRTLPPRNLETSLRENSPCTFQGNSEAKQLLPYF